MNSEFGTNCNISSSKDEFNVRTNKQHFCVLVKFFRFMKENTTGSLMIIKTVSFYCWLFRLTNTHTNSMRGKNLWVISLN